MAHDTLVNGVLGELEQTACNFLANVIDDCHGMTLYLKRISPTQYSEVSCGFDHGVGHPLLLLCDAKALNCRKNKEFKGLVHYAKWPKVPDAVIKVCMSQRQKCPKGHHMDPNWLTCPYYEAEHKIKDRHDAIEVIGQSAESRYDFRNDWLTRIQGRAPAHDAAAKAFLKLHYQLSIIPAILTA